MLIRVVLAAVLTVLGCRVRVLLAPGVAVPLPAVLLVLAASGRRGAGGGDRAQPQARWVAPLPASAAWLSVIVAGSPDRCGVSPCTPRLSSLGSSVMTATCETAPKRFGVLTPPRIDGPLDVAAILADIGRREFVPLPELGAKIGMGEQARKYAISQGLIEANKRPSRSGGYTVSCEEATTLLLAAVLAIAAGVAITVMLRGVKGAGMTGGAAAAALEALPP